MKQLFLGVLTCALAGMLLIACGNGDPGNNATESAATESADPTLIGEEGGTATSPDGRLRVTIPANAYTLPEGAFPEALSLRIEPGPNEGSDMAYRVSDDYFVFVSPREAAANLHAEATIALDIPEEVDEERVLLVGEEERYGLLPNQTFDGTTVTARVTDITQMRFYAAAHAVTDRCYGLIDIGQSCEDSGTCLPDGAETATCGCVDAERVMWPICHGERCQTPITACGGIGENYGGQCEDYGGWTGDCFID